MTDYPLNPDFPLLLMTELEESNKALVDAIGELTAQRDALLAVVKSVEWTDHDLISENMCLCCHRYERTGHAKDCELAKALELCGESVKWMQ